MILLKAGKLHFFKYFILFRNLAAFFSELGNSIALFPETILISQFLVLRILSCLLKHCTILTCSISLFEWLLSLKWKVKRGLWCGLSVIELVRPIVSGVKSSSWKLYLLLEKMRIFVISEKKIFHFYFHFQVLLKSWQTLRSLTWK